MKKEFENLDRAFCMAQRSYSSVNWNFVRVKGKVMIVLTYSDFIDCKAYTKAYKTYRGAKCAETKFFNAMNRKQAEKEKQRMIELYGGENK